MTLNSGQSFSFTFTDQIKGTNVKPDQSATIMAIVNGFIPIFCLKFYRTKRKVRFIFIVKEVLSVLGRNNIDTNYMIDTNYQ